MHALIHAHFAINTCTCCVFQPAFACRLALRSRKNMFFCSISDVFCWFQLWNHWKRYEINKKVWKRLKKVVRPAFMCCKHLKAGWNTQHTLAMVNYIDQKNNSSEINGFWSYFQKQFSSIFKPHLFRWAIDTFNFIPCHNSNLN